MQTDAAKLVPLLAQALHMTPAQVQAMMSKQLPSMSAMLQNLPAMQRDFGGLLGTMQQNVGIFEQVPAGLTHSHDHAACASPRSADARMSIARSATQRIVPREGSLPS